MADTVRTEEELLVLFADNTNQAISAQDMRDFVVSAKVDDIVIADDLNNVAFSGDYNDLINTPSSTDYVVVLPSNSLRNLIVAANSGTTPLTVKGATSQTANLQEWIDNSDSVLVRIANDGTLYAANSDITNLIAGGLNVESYCIKRSSSGGKITLNLDTSPAVDIEGQAISNDYPSACRVKTNNQNTIGLIVQGADTQVSNIQDWRDYNNNTLSYISSDGSLFAPYGIFANGDSDSTYTNPQLTFHYSGSGDYSHFIHTRHNSSLSNNAIDFYLCNGTNSNSISSGSVRLMTLDPGNGTQVFAGSSSSIGLLVKGASSQSANLTEWQNSSNAMLSKVDKNGVVSVHADGSLDSLYTTTTAGVYLGLVTTSTPTVLLAPGGGTSGIIRLDSAFGDFRIIVGGTQVAGLKSSNAAFTTSTLTNTGHIQTGGILLSQRKSLSNYNSLQNEANLYLDGLNGGGWGGTATANGFGIWNAARMTDDAGSGHLAHANEYYVTTAAAASWKTRVINKVGDITSLKEYLRAESNGTYALTSIGGAAVNTTTSLLVSAPTATYTALVVKGASSQSAKLQEWQNSSGTVNASMEDNGNLSIKYLAVTEYVNVFNGSINVGYGSAGLSPTGMVNGRRLTMTPYSPSQITSDQDNYNPVSPWRNLRVSSDAARTITGLVAGQDGEERFFVNVGSFNIILAHESGSSTAENRFLCSTGSSITVLPDNRVAIMYDDTTDRWRVFA